MLDILYYIAIYTQLSSQKGSEKQCKLCLLIKLMHRPCQMFLRINLQRKGFVESGQNVVSSVTDKQVLQSTKVELQMPFHNRSTHIVQMHFLSSFFIPLLFITDPHMLLTQITVKCIDIYCMWIVVLGVVIPRSFVCGYHCFGGMYCLHLQARSATRKSPNHISPAMKTSDLTKIHNLFLFLQNIYIKKCFKYKRLN